MIQTVQSRLHPKSQAAVNPHCYDSFLIMSGWIYILKKYGGKLPLLIRAVPEGSVVPCNNGNLYVRRSDLLICSWTIVDTG